MKAIRLRTEHLHNPIGIDIAKPRLFWSCEGGVIQIAYQITAECDGKTVWDSGKTESSQMTHIPYGGVLTSRDRIEWCVRLWDENGDEGDWSETAVFEMGLLAHSDWRANWITGNYVLDKNRRYPVDCFRKSFEAKKTSRHVCTPPPAEFTRAVLTENVSAILSLLPDIPITASVYNIRPMM